MIDLRTTFQAVDIGDVTCIGRFCPTGTGAEAGGSQIEKVFTAVFGFLTIAAGLGFLIYFIVGAIKWLTAGGETSSVEAAKKTMTNALIGMIIIVAAYAITAIVSGVLGFDILDPSTMLNNIFSTSPAPPAGPGGPGGPGGPPAEPI